MNKLVAAAVASAIGGFIAFLLVDQFTSAREGGAFTRLFDRARLPEGTTTVFNATQEPVTLQ